MFPKEHGNYWARLKGPNSDDSGRWEPVELNSCGWLSCGSEMAIEEGDILVVGDRLVPPGADSDSLGDWLTLYRVNHESLQAIPDSDCVVVAFHRDMAIAGEEFGGNTAIRTDASEARALLRNCEDWMRPYIEVVWSPSVLYGLGHAAGTEPTERTT